MSTLVRQPRYCQVADELRAQIERKELVAGQRLPSFLEMRRRGVSQDTMERAYALLMREGLIERSVGSGVYVAERRSEVAERTPTHIVGCAGMVNNDAQHPYDARILAGVQDAAHAAGYDVLLLRRDETPRWEMLDGLLAIGYGALKMVRSRPEPVPCVGLLIKGVEIPCLSVDDAAGMIALVNHLTALGHRRVAYLTAGASAVAQNRVGAYQSALRANGLEPLHGWVRRALPSDSFDAAVGFREYACRAMRKWLAENWKALDCTALMVHNDQMALGVLEALHEAGLRVPEDVSVAGFDGIELGQSNRPFLTTMEVPLYEMGAAGVRQLLQSTASSPQDDSQETPAPATERIFTARLYAGTSTAAPKPDTAK